METSFDITFTSGLTSRAVRLDPAAALSAALRELGLQRSRPTLVIVGGAGGMSEADLRDVRWLFTEVLVPAAEALGATVIDGGTDAGVMRLMGQARHEGGATFPLVGVAAVGTVALPDGSPSLAGTAPLEPHHTHFVLVPGSSWGDESPWLTRVARVVADEAPSVAVLIDGGEIAWEDVSRSVEDGRPVIAIANTGRTADVLADELSGQTTEGRARRLAASGLVRLEDLGAGPDALAGLIREILLPINHDPGG